MTGNPSAKDIFLEALEQPEAKRDAFVVLECCGDRALEAQVRALLRADRGAEDVGLLEQGAELGQEQPEGTVLSAIERLQGHAPRVKLPSESAGSQPAKTSMSASPLPTPAGPKGNYEIVGEVARGGMGVVLRGRDTDLGREVAVKVLHERLHGSESIVERFIEEAQIGGQLQHPGIVPVYELGLMADDRPYFTMKLVKGRTLASLLEDREEAGSNRRRLLDVFEATCQTVAYAHSRGVIHRDLKPANIMVGAFGEVQVVDWGLAKVLARGARNDKRKLFVRRRKGMTNEWTGIQ